MNPSTTPLKVVIVEDNAALADIYKTRLEILGYQCTTAYDGEEALATIERERPNLVLLDLMVPKIAGDQILAHMRANEWGKNIKVLIISNLNEADAPAGLRQMGIAGYAVKANLTNDALDRFVDAILKPEGQEEDVLLETKGSENYPTTMDQAGHSEQDELIAPPAMPITTEVPVAPEPAEPVAPAPPAAPAAPSTPSAPTVPPQPQA